MALSEMASLLMGIVALIGVILTWRKMKPEERHYDAETLRDMQETLANAVSLNKDLQARLKSVEDRTVILLAESQVKADRLNDLEKKYAQVVLENRRLEQYVKMLIAEIRKLNGTVPEMPMLEVKG